MPVLCFGPVCIPLNLLLPFLLGIAYRYGWFKWVRREWLTITYWKQRFTGQRAKQAASGPEQPTSAVNGVSSTSSQEAAAAGCEAGMKYVSERDVCRLVPADDANSQQQQQADNTAGSNANTVAAAAAAGKNAAAAAAAAAPAAGKNEVRLRRGYNGVGCIAGNL